MHYGDFPHVLQCLLTPTPKHHTHPTSQHIQPQNVCPQTEDCFHFHFQILSSFPRQRGEHTAVRSSSVFSNTAIHLSGCLALENRKPFLSNSLSVYTTGSTLHPLIPALILLQKSDTQPQAAMAAPIRAPCWGIHCHKYA